MPADFKSDFYNVYREVNDADPPKIVDWGRGWYYLKSATYESKKMRASKIAEMTATLRGRVTRKEKA